MAAIGDALEEEQPKRRTAFIPWRWLAVASFLIIAISVGVLITNKLRGSPTERGTQALVEAFRTQRWIEPRLSGGFMGGEFKPSVGEGSSIDTGKLEQGRELIMDAVARSDASAHLPYARLLLSKSEKLPEALKHLNLALTLEPESADAHNDLGVCFIQQGKVEDAIDEFEEALKRKPDLPEALFNRALCYERLLLRDAASAEYGRLFGIERDRSWLDEIKQRQQGASSPLVVQGLQHEIVAAFEAAVADGKIGEAKTIADQNFEFMWRHASNEFPVEHLKAALAGDSEGAERALAKIELIGAHFAETKGDSSISDLAAYFRHLQNDDRLAERRLFAEYAEAEKLISSQNSSEAGAAFQRLSKLFADRGNHVMELFSAFYTASCLYTTGQLTASIAILRQAIASVETEKRSYLRAGFLSQLGTACSLLGQDSSAVKYYEQGIEGSRGMPWLEAKLRQFMGNTLWRLGDLENALASLRESTRLFFVSAPTPKELAYNYLQIADIYRIRGHHSLALLYAKQAITFFDQPADINRVAQASAFMAVEHGRLGQFDQAETELQFAIDSLEKIEHGKRDYTEAVVRLRGGEMAALRADLALAERYYSRATALAEMSEDNKILVIKALRGRAEAYVRAKDVEKAHADLEQAIELIERYRAGIADRQNRGAFLDASQGVFDQMILLNIRALGQKAEAFDFSEGSRARILLDEFSSRGMKAQGELRAARQKAATGFPPRDQAKPLTLAEVQRALPDNVRLAAYSVTNERTFIFLITRSGFEVEESAATTEILDHLVHEYVSGIKARASLEELQEPAKKLYEYLIEPIQGKLNDGKGLCILPDKALHFLPFAALIDPAGRYLIKSQRLSYAPSASAFVRSVEEARMKPARKDERILAVGNPQFDREAFPALADLLDAEREAKESAAFYENYAVLSAAGATEPRVRAELMSCDVAHLAVHCLVEEKSKWLATLVLASPGSGTSEPARDSKALVLGAQLSADDGLLYLNEVYSMRLPRTRLVILSACESGLGQYYRGEGIVSLVRPFLAARVPTVVASLWSVDSRATADLMIQFHRERKSHNFGASEALQAAQVEMIQSADYQHPFYWAAFISVGAN